MTDEAAPKMTLDSVRERHRILVETDWRKEAEGFVKETFWDKGQEVSRAVRGPASAWSVEIRSADGTVAVHLIA